MKVKSVFFILFCFLTALFSCTKEDYSEKVGYLTIAPYSLDNNQPVIYCFDKIGGPGLPAFGYNVCNDTTTYLIKLPLNVARDTCIYIFSKDTRKDTLKIEYQRKTIDIKNSFQKYFSNLKITYSTFDSLKVVCTSTQSSTCDEKDFTARIFF